MEIIDYDIYDVNIDEENDNEAEIIRSETDPANLEKEAETKAEINQEKEKCRNGKNCRFGSKCKNSHSEIEEKKSQEM